MQIRQKGFSIVELLIVIGISSIIIVFGVALLNVSASRTNLRGQSATLVDVIRRAQWQTMHGHADVSYGVRLETSEFIIFEDTFTPGAPTNIVFPLPNDVEVGTVSLNGGGSEILFTGTFGETTNYGSVTLNHTNSEDTRTVTINQVGMADAE